MLRNELEGFQNVIYSKKQKSLNLVIDWEFKPHRQILQPRPDMNNKMMTYTQPRISISDDFHICSYSGLAVDRLLKWKLLLGQVKLTVAMKLTFPFFEFTTKSNIEIEVRFLLFVSFEVKRPMKVPLSIVQSTVGWQCPVRCIAHDRCIVSPLSTLSTRPVPLFATRTTHTGSAE